MSKELFAELEERGLLEYGSVISGAIVRRIIGVQMPEIGTKREFDDVALAELSAVDYVRNILLGRGKYLTGSGGNYRILLPSENKRQVDIYMSQADNKLRRALKLSKNMPSVVNRHDNTSARIMMKRESIREHATA